MRIPHVHKLQLDPSEVRSEETVKVHIEPQEYIDDICLFEDPKEFGKWIGHFKYFVRHTWEYEELIWFLKHKRGMGRCGIHPNLTIWDGHKIEVHHTPFTITDIITIIIKKRMEKNESLKMQDIAREVMEVHYLGLVGLYPLCQLCHGLAHADFDELFIPLDSVFGEPEQFVKIYKPYMTESMTVKWDNIVQLNKGYGIIRNNLPLALQKKYIYIETEDPDGFSNQISTNKLVSFINEISG